MHRLSPPPYGPSTPRPRNFKKFSFSDAKLYSTINHWFSNDSTRILVSISSQCPAIEHYLGCKKLQPFASYFYRTCEVKNSKKCHDFPEFSTTMILTSANARNRMESSGKITGSSRKLWATDENGSSIPGREIFGFFWRLSVVSNGKEEEFCRKTQEKFENFPVRNTASMKSLEFPEVTVSLPDCPSWDTTYR